MKKASFIAAAALMLPLAAIAADAPKDYFADVNGRMHEAMSVEPSGNVDVDFARGMIAHHQGAIDMAKVVLKEGKDPEIHALAEKIIAAQGPEIEQMQKWLAAHGKKK